MQLQESGEMYLEAILVLSHQKPVVRAVDVSEYRHYSKPSVSRGLKILKENGYLTIDDNGFITLTPKGRRVAEKIYERHRVLSQTLMALGVDEAHAVDDACRIEHVISDESFAAIKQHLKDHHAG
jgi:Mn-dependent DtxR family transcriptional regulator